jgi:predicted transcriptional regulator
MGEDGRQQYSEQQFLTAVREQDTPTTSAIAEQIGCTRQAADYRLRKLRDEDRVESTMVGNTLVWSLSE